MPNPNQAPNTSETEVTLERSHAQIQDTGQKSNRAVEQEGNRFLHISREELMQVDPANLLPSEVPDFIAAHKAWIAKYEKIIADAKEKEAVAAAETEAIAATKTEAAAPDLSGIDTIVADQEPIAEEEAEPTEPITRTIPVVEAISVEEAGEVKTITPERVAVDKEDTKNNPKAKGFFNTITKKVFPVALAAAVALGGIVGMATTINHNNSQEGTQPTIEQVDSKADQSGENQEAGHGIKDGYYETGMFMSQNKGTPYDFANAAEVASVVGDDECEVMKAVAHDQVESLADQLALIPTEVKAKYGVSSEFNDLSILETEKKLESLSDVEYDKLIKQIDQIWDAAFTESVTLNGEYQNAYMRTSATDSERATHHNTELVACTTQENGTQATKFFWTTDGNANSQRIGDLTSKISRDANGKINKQCTQIVTLVGTFSFFYDGLTEIPHDPNHPDQPTPPGPTPPEQIKPKDYENLERIDQNILNDIAEDIGTDEVRVTPNPGVSQEDLTEKPSSDAYEGTEATIVQNEPSREAEPVQDQISEDNNYSENRGGANANEYAPVEANEAAQAAADAAEIPVNQAPTGGQELNNVLNDLGIN